MLKAININQLVEVERQQQHW